MTEAKFILSKKKLIEQLNVLDNLGLKISYSYKTNKEVGNVLQDISDVNFSIFVKYIVLLGIEIEYFFAFVLISIFYLFFNKYNIQYFRLWFIWG